MGPEVETEVFRICRRALAWAGERDYTGYNKHDGLNSPLLRGLSCGNKWLRIIFIQGVMRFPVNIRPVLGVKKTVNPKGLALFARACLNLYRYSGEDVFLLEARRLLDRLLAHPSEGFPGLSWGYGYPWQDLGFFAPAGFPNRIVTYFVGRALVDAYEVTGDKMYLDAAERVVEFILGVPKRLYEDEEMLCLSYVPVAEINMAVMDVSALSGALCAMVGKHAGRPGLIREARKLMCYVVDKQTDSGAWFYTHPPGDSHITHDNYHTGEIVDAIADYTAYSGDTRFAESYGRGLDFYRENLFTRSDRPKWMHNIEYPYDIHGYSQGIITFTRAGMMGLAEKMVQNAIHDMWNDRAGRFRYQKGRLRSKNFTLMRWCQAWMTFALSAFLNNAMEAGDDDRP